MAGLSEALEQLQEFDVSELDFDRIGVWPLAGRIFVCVLSVFLVLSATYYFFVSDLILRHESEVAKEVSLKSDFELKAHESANLVPYRNQMEEMTASFGALLQQLPKENEVPGLLEDIDEKGSETGLSISSIQLQAEKPAEFYVELPIEITVQGSYHDLGGFVSGIAGMPRIVTLHDYTIKPDDRGVLEMVIAARTYRYKAQKK
jgi:type IV pilus assembly protein PilO